MMRLYCGLLVYERGFLIRHRLALVEWCLGLFGVLADIS